MATRTVFYHGTDQPPDALAAALDDLGGSLPASRGDAEIEGPERGKLFRSEERSLWHFAQAREILADATCLIPPSKDDGREHRVFFDPAIRLYIKATHPGSYGGYMGIGYEIDPDSQCYVEKPLVLAATPREYLDRLRLANEVFNDEIRLTRIIDTPSGLSVESSQPAIVGRPASAREIRSEMAELGFREVHTDGVFYRDNDQVLVWDLEGNTLITTEGYFAPIDAMMRTASLELANAFHAG